jgi:hypothetical protein
LKRLFPWFIRYFNFVNGWVQRFGIRNKYWSAAITIFLTLCAGSFLFGQASRLLTWVVFRVAHIGQIAPIIPGNLGGLPSEASTKGGGGTIPGGPLFFGTPTHNPEVQTTPWGQAATPPSQAAPKGESNPGLQAPTPATGGSSPKESAQSGQGPKIDVISHGVTAQGVLEGKGVAGSVQGPVVIGGVTISGVGVTIGGNSTPAPTASTTPNPKQDQTGKIIEDTVGGAAKKLFGF